MLHIVMGPMFSGKTLYCIKIGRRFRAIDKNVLFVNSVLDNRYEKHETKVSSHDGDTEKCISLDKLSLLEENELYKVADVVIIEEAQFFPDLFSFVSKQADLWPEKYMVVAGLSGDFARKAIGDIIALVPYAEKVEKLSGFCSYCKDGTPGVYTKRLSTTEKAQIVVGGKELYACVCRKHYVD